MVLTNYNIEDLKKEVLRCKKILNLHNIEIRIDKIQNKICYTRFFDKEKTIISTNAIVWNKSEWKDFKTIKAFISTNKILTTEEIKWLLLKEIYSESMKNLL